MLAGRSPHAIRKSNSYSLFAYGRAVKTPFGLLGTDERALTFALGYTMWWCPRLLQTFLGAVAIKRFRISHLRNAEIHLETRRDEGITDIEVIIPNRLHLIIEAKVGLGLPTLDQCRRYIQRLKSSAATYRLLVILVGMDCTPTLALYRQKDKDCDKFLAGLQWVELLKMRPLLLEHYAPSSEEGRWARAFYDFLEGEFHMNSYTEEVWIVPAKKKPLWEDGWSFYDTHVKGRIYYRSKRDGYTNQKPLYIALRAQGKVESIQRVLKIEHEVILVNVLPQMRNIKDGWPREVPHTVWYLSEPVYLPKILPTGDPSMRGRHLFCDMDILLSSVSIKEAAERMKKRRASSD